LKQLKHPHIIKMETVLRAENEKDMYILFELMDIDLYSLIRENLLTERHRRYIAYQIALSIQYMHNVGLVHRDIKPSNVLVNEDSLAKICDFGLVRGTDENEEKDSDTILT
jgi:mitogen-activated protein kinase 15